MCSSCKQELLTRKERGPERGTGAARSRRSQLRGAGSSLRAWGWEAYFGAALMAIAIAVISLVLIIGAAKSIAQVTG